jgi:hypothetical protein
MPVAISLVNSVTVWYGGEMVLNAETPRRKRKCRDPIFAVLFLLGVSAFISFPLQCLEMSGNVAVCQGENEICKTNPKLPRS